jgi:preprotein translocase subunit YajC
MKLNIKEVKNMEKEIILIILGCLVMGFFLWRQDKKKKEEETSNRLYEAENNITHLNNLNNRKRFK